jgi:hypothetical protein
MERPSHKELLGKIGIARALLEAGQWAAADPVKLAANFMDLDLYLTGEQHSGLAHAVREITPESYAGSRPPKRSYERVTKGAEMFAFSWWSRFFERAMYLKFSLAGADKHQRVFVYSIHPSRPARGKP